VGVNVTIIGGKKKDLKIAKKKHGNAGKTRRPVLIFLSDPSHELYDQRSVTWICLRQRDVLRLVVQKPD
jgi:hypothetical protein